MWISQVAGRCRHMNDRGTVTEQKGLRYTEIIRTHKPDGGPVNGMVQAMREMVGA